MGNERIHLQNGNVVASLQQESKGLDGKHSDFHNVA